MVGSNDWRAGYPHSSWFDADDSLTDGPLADPRVLELAGKLADLLGLAEHIQRFLPTQRLMVQQEHRAMKRTVSDDGT